MSSAAGMVRAPWALGLVIGFGLLLHCSGGSSLTLDDVKAMCTPYSDLWSQVGIEMKERWGASGISLQLMQRTIKEHTTRKMGQKGFAAAFINGTAYLVDQPKLENWVGHHVGLHAIYMQLLVWLSETYGSLIPDVEFVISTIDRPLNYAVNRSVVYEPVMRFCKTDVHTDILIPIFHFHMKDFGQLLDIIPEINRNYTWESRKPVLFGRFSNYLRHMHVNDTTAMRKGAGGKSICTHPTDASKVRACNVRRHFAAWSAKYYPDTIDVGNRRRIPMAQHAKYKYLLHLDGQGLSSRLDQLLPLGSLIFKEESGYRGFYHHLLKPYEHYIPFWKKVPEEALDQIKWAKEHDEEAQRMGAKAQAFAKMYLTREARACYWFVLFKKYAKLFRYKPGPTPGRKYMEYYKPISDFLKEDLKQYDRGYWLRKWHFSP